MFCFLFFQNSQDSKDAIDWIEFVDILLWKSYHLFYFYYNTIQLLYYY